MWHTKTIEEVSKFFGVNSKYGLSYSEVRERLYNQGENKLPEQRKGKWYIFLFRQFKSPLVYILLVGALLTIFLREWTDAIVIILAICMNIAVGFWQEYKSNNILNELKKIVKVDALVTRDGVLEEIDATYLVRGDIIHLKPGNRVPADARVIESHNLYVNQTVLTGEATSDEKHARVLRDNIPLPDRENMIYMGTIVTGGSAQAIVVGTGKITEIGKIALLTQDIKNKLTPLEKRMSSLGKIIAYTVFTFALIIFIVGIIRNFNLEEIIITTIAVSVAGVPEGLPASISIILALSAQRILKKQGVIKKLLATETLGSTTVICTDKTGTLTQGKMVVQKMITDNVSKAHEVLAFANNADIKEIGDKRIPIGEPTDVAKLEYVLNESSGNLFDKNHKQIGFMEFNSHLKILASINKVYNSYFLYVNGAPEEILSRSNINDGEKKRYITEYEELAKKGFRVIALAYKELKSFQITVDKELTKKEIESLSKGLVFCGLVAIADPIRNEVKDAIDKARNAGIRTIMVTGDHRLTAIVIAKKLGMMEKVIGVLEGKDLDIITNEQLSSFVKNTNVFARMMPEHKIRIVNALKKNNEVVAMTGDGINDAPALVAADIGIAVGSGTDIAKEAADLVLLNNSFSTIVLAIEQGRIAFENIRKVSVLLLTSSFSEIILIMSALLIPLLSHSFELLPLPLTAIQILYVNLVEDSLPNIALAFEPGEEDIMKVPPVKQNAPILNKESKSIIFIVGIFIDIVLVGVFLFLFLKKIPTNVIQTTIFAAIGIDTLLYIYSIKSLHKPIWKERLFNNKYLTIAVVIGFIAMFVAIYLPSLNQVLGTVPLTTGFLFTVFILAIAKMGFIEMVKGIYRNKYVLE